MNDLSSYSQPQSTIQGSSIKLIRLSFPVVNLEPDPSRLLNHRTRSITLIGKRLK
jgi:hypothetical protein